MLKDIFLLKNEDRGVIQNSTFKIYNFLNWKALYVNSRAEKKVMVRLMELGIDAYVPLKKDKRQWSDRKKTVVVPLINGYVFVRITDKQREDVFRANGVIQYVRFNGEDAIIRDEEIKILKDIEEKGYSAEARELWDFEPGEKTIISHGPFKGLTGTIERHAGKDVYSIHLESIGYSLRVNLPAEILNKSEKI